MATAIKRIPDNILGITFQLVGGPTPPPGVDKRRNGVPVNDL
jgi:hypothetical protein